MFILCYFIEMRQSIRNEAVPLDLVFKALSHPMRRQILKLVSRKSRTVLGVADRHPISLNGVSKHLKVLEEAGLIRREAQGNSRIIHLRIAPLKNAIKWMNTYSEFWDRSLEKMKSVLEDV